MFFRFLSVFTLGYLSVSEKENRNSRLKKIIIKKKQDAGIAVTVTQIYTKALDFISEFRCSI